MKRVIGLIPIVLLLVLVVLINPLAKIRAEQPLDMFVITNADATNTMSFIGSSTLNNLIQNTGPRFVIQYANEKHVIPFLSPPGDLHTLLQSVEERFVIQYANGKSALPIIPPPANLVTLLQVAADRFVLQYANASNALILDYPVGLVGDSNPPIFSQINSQRLGGKLTVTVNTNEYTLAQMDYGLTSGQYTNSVYDDSFDYEHVFTITGLQEDGTYYFQVTITDRSGNSTVSTEDSSSPSTSVYIYLPLLVK